MATDHIDDPPTSTLYLLELAIRVGFRLLHALIVMFCLASKLSACFGRGLIFVGLSRS